ncbi:MAG: serine hydrolase [Chloroflexi bacterium]|nr:serine hydrolase [Chloroflexota bacterium]
MNFPPHRWWLAALLVVIVLALAAVLPGVSTESPQLANVPPVRDYWPTDGWREHLPEAVGLDAARLDAMNRHIQERLPHIYSVLVVRHGSLAFEQYYQGFHADIPFEVASVTKSVTSALVGIALEQRYLRSIQQRLVEFFPEFYSDSLDSQVKDITIEHLLTMSSGFHWSEDAPWFWPRSGSWMRFAAGMTIIYPPGEQFAYNTPATHLLSGILTRATGTPLAEYTQRNLFDPLGIAPPEWMTDPEGYTTGAHGLRLRARDMAKLGYLYLNRGEWDGQQLVPADWVDISTRRHITGGFPQQADYGYLWWVTAERGYSYYFAAGYGGQYIAVIPNLDVVVVITSQTDALHTENRALIGQFVIPAARS